MLESPHYLRHSTDVIDDPFSDILKLANAQSVSSGGFMAGGAWAIRFPPMEKIKFSAMVKGNCWLSIDGEQAVRVEQGDVLLLSAQRAFTLASDTEVMPVQAADVFTPNISTMAKLNDGEDCIQTGGFVRLDPVSGRLLTDVLPPLIHIRSASPQAAVLQWLLAQLVREQSAELPGSSLASAQLAQLIFVQILRGHLETSDFLAPGWLRALADRSIAPALRLMHGDPARPWHLKDLARSAAMSRTTFALRFKTVAGVPPLTYLLNWRMRLAERALREQNISVAALAVSLGYTSESAFSNSFKRNLGMAPRRYREAARAGNPVSPSLRE
jgi:AraC-like DNA-binding protein